MPDPLLTFPRTLWSNCMAELRLRGRGFHESGCFVLGTREGERRRAACCIYYDELDPDAYASGVCVLGGNSFPKLWDTCRTSNLTVIADIHTHGGAACQSEADRRNPMLARPGHLALIVPRFASSPVWRLKLGFYCYEGDHQWTNLSGWRALIHLRTRGNAR